jgi:hypothetical protein
MLALPETPFWKFVAVIICGWILLAIFFPVVVGLLVFGVIVGIASLIVGGIATIIRGLLG